MGCIDTITYDRFPEQKGEDYTYPVGCRVKVCYHYDTSKYHYGTIVRDDLEEPFETIIKLDNGRYLRATECQFSYIDGEISDDVCEWESVKLNYEWKPSCEPNSTYNVFGVAWFKRCPYCGKKIKVVE